MLDVVEILSLGLGGLGFLLALLVYRLIKGPLTKRIVLICAFMVFSLVILVIVGYYAQHTEFSGLSDSAGLPLRP